MQTSQKGINVVGYTEGMFGLGEAVRLNIKAAQKHEIPLNLINYDKIKNSKNYRYSLEYPINLVQISLNDLESFFGFIDPYFFKQRYTILFMVWESEYIAPELAENLNLFNEIWTTSKYCKTIFQKTFPNPIKIVPHPVEVDIQRVLNKKKIGYIDKTKFSFLFIFSYHSSIERKNPFFLIESFKKAFGDRDDVELVIKTVGASKHKKSRQRLQQCLSNNIKIYDVELDKDSVNQLIQSCDAYVSMHHSEGFGLTLAEAMYLGKPVIATNYSGNTEFMNDDNSFLVDYELGYIENSDTTFCPKTLWGNPLLDDAVEKLRSVYENSEVREKKAANASLFVKDALSFFTIGSTIKKRVDYLYANLDVIVASQNQFTFILNKLQTTKAENQNLKREIHRMKKNVIIRFMLMLKDGVRKMKSKRI
ncbi:glycosyltransferase family 4 protein [Flavobacterium polysaccharolyticum]|uniref:Glycosyltransferase family 4 protein n=1 Tax=Flavobacterium polysaccharolyticum TaxID=3133148 RepID=A0ABU9NNX8_9FLAO